MDVLYRVYNILRLVPFASVPKKNYFLTLTLPNVERGFKWLTYNGFAIDHS